MSSAAAAILVALLDFSERRERAPDCPSPFSSDKVKEDWTLCAMSALVPCVHPLLEDGISMKPLEDLIDPDGARCAPTSTG